MSKATADVAAVDSQDELDTDCAETDWGRFESQESKSISDLESYLESTPKKGYLSPRSDVHANSLASPAVQIGNWIQVGEITVLYQGSFACLENSNVRHASFRGFGNNGEVVLQDLAIKSVAKTQADDAAMLLRECSMMQKLGNNHPHTLQSFGFQEFDSEIMLLTRLAPDGDLCSLAPSGSCLEENEVRKLDMQMLSALSYLQERRVVHGDVKPQNIFLTQAAGAYIAQLADFGLAHMIPVGEHWVTLQHVQGSYGYIPSEVKHKKQLGFAADLFALGVMTFRQVSSYDPFCPASAVEQELLFDIDCWLPVSDQCQELVISLLASAPELRGSAHELLNSNSWFVADEASISGRGIRIFASPQPLEILGFHCLNDAAKVWSSCDLRGDATP